MLIADGQDICEYDIRGEFDDGDALEHMDLDLSDLRQYTFTIE